MKHAQYASDKQKRATYTFNLPQINQIVCANCLDTYRLPMMIPLPDICEAGGQVVRGFIAKLYTREDPRFKEERVRIKSNPQAKRGRS
jgi:hypothetical protein